ncbi:hypothetical protein FF011L_44840 [Roseimaritima multifibrata]|uniref:Uncharacterized protein n=1 Tax=Roseimaritima multifibrata TaxID=1930274 RepID=A0A517MLC3_9BACT|nr:hypothetical protein FF011L_44840 [Roseimaritima multifibrata]
MSGRFSFPPQRLPESLYGKEKPTDREQGGPGRWAVLLAERSEMFARVGVAAAGCSPPTVYYGFSPPRWQVQQYST